MTDTNKMEKLLKTGEPIPLYPDTSIPMIPGDVLYSHKRALSSFLVGHVGLIGEDYRVYHVNRWGNKGHADSMPIYLSRHKKGEKLTILRFSNQIIARAAADWSMANISSIDAYKYTRDLTDIKNNYCSKYIWQAYYFGTTPNVDLLANDLDAEKKRYIMPSGIFRRLEVVGSFRTSE
ncbi:hypothetical protein CWR48_19790 [Oceanobacillus arenosus]|uniref:LRAT domain-containing protein n=1 Tax=Oceanobacillus arenosus TaxID=1229153 RepID=A0A3D8PJ75_9BACI|nr:hypothetical protein [Oceanobacillus arenosus]RDW15268.1 hypothetical protein CWR48_19790 [Oceanobacillus arenosus]